MFFCGVASYAVDAFVPLNSSIFVVSFAVSLWCFFARGNFYSCVTVTALQGFQKPLFILIFGLISQFLPKIFPLHWFLNCSWHHITSCNIYVSVSPGVCCLFVLCYCVIGDWRVIYGHMLSWWSHYHLISSYVCISSISRDYL